MTRLFLLIIFLLMGSYSPKAAQEPGEGQEFQSELDNIKNPFEDGLPKPVVITNKPTHYEGPKPIVFLQLKPKPALPPVISFPELNLQGIIVGEDIHQAIINDQVVPLHGTIEGVRVDSVTKQGVELFFKGKKIFLKVD